MSQPLLLDIVQYFTDNNLVEGDGIDTFRDYMPETPNDIIVLGEYKGSSKVHYEELVNRSVQIKVRNTDSDSAREKALELFKSLSTNGNKRLDLTSDRWGQIHIRNTPIKLEVDENKRIVYGFNIGITTNYE